MRKSIRDKIDKTLQVLNEIADKELGVGPEPPKSIRRARGRRTFVCSKCKLEISQPKFISFDSDNPICWKCKRKT